MHTGLWRVHARLLLLVVMLLLHGVVVHDAVLGHLVSLAAVLLILPDFVPFIVTARVVGGGTIDKVAVEEAVGAAVVVHPSPKDAEVRLQRLQQLVDDVATRHRVVAKGVVGPLRGVVAGTARPHNRQTVVVEPR